jgi:type III restriction enzyme
MIRPSYDEGLVIATAASLSLREPNKEALKTVALRVADHFAREDAGLFEGVIDVATGVGKTYVIAALIDYYTALGYRNFVIITPGKTVNRKTIANFTAGHPKSLLTGMETQPFVVTSESFASSGVASAMTDETIANLYVFTVQALLTPTSKADRKTHVFQEGLGADFYQALVDLPDLIVLADEYHSYTGKKFSAAVRDLRPQMLIGLTATTPTESESLVIYRYPLAAAIAEGYVKTPVIAARHDDRADTLTKLTDGALLLDVKRREVEKYRAENPSAPVINPVMLVLAPDTDAADECVGILRHPNFQGGAYADAILNIHSAVDDVDEALANLDAVEDPDSPVRVIVSVGMIKEGWDVKNVYVICSLRASVSQILTEQTLGRGLRLPFGEITGREMLDTLEVVAHERYDALITRVDKMREAFIDSRTVLTGDGQAIKQEPVGLNVSPARAGQAAIGQASVADIDERLAHGEEVLAETRGLSLVPRADMTLTIPVVTETTIESPFSLSEITDLEPFRRIGRGLAASPEANLRRTVIEATVTVDATGQRQAGFRRRLAADTVAASGSSVTVEEAMTQLVGDVMSSGCAPDRPNERNDLRTRILAAVLDGLGPAATLSLPAFERRAADAVITEIHAFNRRSEPKVVFSEVEMRPFTTVRYGRATVVADRFGPFSRGVGYTGFMKSLYTQDWFDSNSAERDLANLLDDAEEVRYWLRLLVGDLPLPWRGGGRHYNPDFIVEDTDGIHWVIEGKRDSDADAVEVKAKRTAAQQWANYVTGKTGEQWRYLFVTESDIRTAKGSWVALRQHALAE